MHKIIFVSKPDEHTVSREASANNKHVIIVNIVMAMFTLENKVTYFSDVLFISYLARLFKQKM